MTKRALEKAAFQIDEMPAIYEAIKAAEDSLKPQPKIEPAAKPQTGQARHAPSKGGPKGIPQPAKK